MDVNYYTNIYGDFNEIDLPETHRAYFDASCHEYSQCPTEKKLLDLAYVITHGFDVKSAVKDILSTHSHVSESAIHHAILDLLTAVNHVNVPSIDRGNGLDVDIDIFIEDLLRRYRLPLDGSIPHYLADDFRYVSDMDVFKSNGWELASKDINNYQMFKDDDFVFYPGDAEVLQKYHQANLDSGNICQIFPVGPIPEPWYGNPMTAKIIILGDMPEYDDFIARCANMVLSLEPRLMEEVQEMIRNWFSLSGYGMYNDYGFGRCRDLCVGDAYNSVTYRHWVQEIRELASEILIDDQLLLDQACVINANAYYSVGGSDALAAGLLPSQYYLRILVNYLVNNRTEKPIFIIPSSRLHKIWKRILGYWIENEVMLTSDKIIITAPNSKMSLSSSALGVRNINKIKNLIQNGI